jgi:hypothetical protein
MIYDQSLNAKRVDRCSAFCRAWNKPSKKRFPKTNRVGNNSTHACKRTSPHSLIYILKFTTTATISFTISKICSSASRVRGSTARIDLRELDDAREKNPLWFQSNQMLGGVCYVDLFANDLEGVKSKIPYFKELGLTYLHLMPLFKAPEGENDGGYAVSSYREVHPPLGTMEQLASLARVSSGRHQPRCGFGFQSHFG